MRGRGYGEDGYGNDPSCAPPGGSRDRIHTIPPTCDGALLELWLDYVRETVGRYGNRVHTWEIWNEPGEATFWSGGAGDYARLLVKTAAVIKSVDPRANIVAPATSGVVETRNWLAQMRQAEPAVLSAFEVLSLHFYVPPLCLSDGACLPGGQSYSYFDGALGNELPELRRPAGGKPIWITEFGFSSGPRRSGEPWFVGDERLQARFLAQQVVATLAAAGSGVERLMPYVLGEHGGFGLVREGDAPKPAYDAFRTAVAHLGGAEGRGRFRPTPDSFGFRFAAAGGPIEVLWTAEGQGVDIPVPGAAQLYDLYGAPLKAVTIGGGSYLRVGADPVYVVHRAAPTAATPTLTPPAPPAAPTSPPAAPPVAGTMTSSVPGSTAPDLFPQTGKTVRGLFLDRWREQGGLAIYGYPISNELLETLEDGRPYTVQYFERARFEYHPENAAPNDVLLGQFGRAIFAEAAGR